MLGGLAVFLTVIIVYAAFVPHTPQGLAVMAASSVLFLVGLIDDLLHIKSLVAAAKERPNTISYATPGVASIQHLSVELMTYMTGTKFVHVPYQGTGPAGIALMGGQVDLMFDAISTMADNARAGQVRILGTTGKKRSPLMPDVPTVSEAGVAGYEATIWLGIMAPANTPKPIVD